MTIRDVGYHPYEGERLPHSSRYRVLARRMLSLAWASGLVKTTVILGSFPMVVCAVILFFKVKAVHLLAAHGQVSPLGDPDSIVFTCTYWCQIWFAFTVSLLVAAPAISDDVRSGAFQFYFARPVNRLHYLAGKMVPVLVLVGVVTAAPALILSLLRAALSQSADEALGSLLLVASTLVYTPIYALVMALPPVALSTLGRRSGTIQGLWTMIFFLSWLLGELFASLTDQSYIALLSLPANLRLLGQYLFGLPPSYAIEWYYPAAVLILLVLGSGVLILRRLERVEVFV
jgi:hypothetical protein